jgi:hypothetical protein
MVYLQNYLFVVKQQSFTHSLKCNSISCKQIYKTRTMSEIIKLICLVRNDIERQDFLLCFAAKANKFYIYLKCNDSVFILLCQSTNQFLNCLKRVETNVPIVFSDVTLTLVLYRYCYRFSTSLYMNQVSVKL